MPRQNQDHGSYVRGVTATAALNKGGSNAASAVQAVDNLQGIHRSSVGQANGIAWLKEDGLLPVDYFKNLDIYVGPRIKGPATLYRGCSARFLVTNFASYQFASVEIKDHDKNALGYIFQGGHFSFTVPTGFPDNQLVIEVQYDGKTRSITLPIQDPSIAKPVFQTKPNSEMLTSGWFLMEAPVFNGLAAIDRYVPSSSGTFRGATETTASDASIRREYATYSGRGQVPIDAEVAEVVICGRLTNPNNLAWAKIDDAKRMLSDSYTEHSMRFKGNKRIDYVTSPGESITIGLIRPVSGNKTPVAQQTTEYFFEARAVGDDTWFPVSSIVSSSPRVTFSGLPTGNIEVRAKIVYMSGEVVLNSPWSDSLPLTVKSNYNGVGSAVKIPSDLVSTRFFGRSVAYKKASNGDSLYIGCTVNGKNCVELRSLDNNPAEWTSTDQRMILQPDEPTRIIDGDFGHGISVSEDGDMVLISAPSAKFSDLSGTTGAVYVFKRLGTRFVFLKRITDVNRTQTGFGTMMAQSGAMAFIGSERTVSQQTKVFAYAVEDTVSEEKYILTATYTHPATSSWFSLASPQRLPSMPGNLIPIIATGADTAQQGGQVFETISLITYNTATNTFEVKHVEFSEDVVDLYGTDTLTDSVAMVYQGYNGATNLHEGHFAYLNRQADQLILKKWGVNATTFSVSAPEDRFSQMTLWMGGTLLKSETLAMNDAMDEIYIGMPYREYMTWNDAFGLITTPDVGGLRVITFITANAEVPA